MSLPLHYRILNRLIRWTGRQFIEVHMGRWHQSNGGLYRTSIPMGVYRLTRRDEQNLGEDATELDRVLGRRLFPNDRS